MSLQDLLNQNSQVNHYYSSLPDYVKEMIKERRNSIKTEADIHRFANTIMQNSEQNSDYIFYD